MSQDNPRAPMTSAQRTLRAQIAAHDSWAHTDDRSARTAPARKAMLDKFEQQVDPNNELTPAERAKRAEHARKAHFKRLALASAKSRRARSQSTATVGGDASGDTARSGAPPGAPTLTASGGTTSAERGGSDAA